MGEPITVKRDNASLRIESTIIKCLNDCPVGYLTAMGRCRSYAVFAVTM